MKMTEEEAIEKVEEFVRQHGHEGEIVVLQVVERRGGYIDVPCLKPYGLFIIRPDGSIEDNYQVFEKE